LSQSVKGNEQEQIPGRKISISGVLEKGDNFHKTEVIENQEENKVQEQNAGEQNLPSSDEKPPDYHYVKYTATEDDNLYGIALTHSIKYQFFSIKIPNYVSPAVLKRDNSLWSELVYPGQVNNLSILS